MRSTESVTESWFFPLTHSVTHTFHEQCMPLVLWFQFQNNMCVQMGGFVYVCLRVFVRMGESMHM